MDDIRFPIGDWFESAFEWFTGSFGAVFDIASDLADGSYSGLSAVFNAPPFWVVTLLLALLGWLARGWRFAVFTLVGLVLIQGMNQWMNAMHTLALVIIATLIAVAIAIPVGIWAARTTTGSSVIKPVLDFMQTMPVFVYLIPAVFMFGVGTVPGMFATVIFALPPGVRLTELGIRQVDAEVVEAGHAFGSNPRRILQQVQFPLALPTVMAGVNQVIMLALSMTVVAGIIGSEGLGRPVLEGISRVNIGLGFEAGLAVVIIAIYLDRLTAAFGARSAVARAQQAAAE